ncbi:hypothetical protein ACIQ00_11015 [Micrococcus luteus]|uniref:hypothetical protein n=1 Tax=Micrococcus luteus TaxID=1270 RepID=UPI003435E7A7
MTTATCEYDSRPVYDTWDGIKMCETCYADSEDQATCQHCQTPTGRTERTPFFGDLIFRCATCQSTWI